MSRKGYQRRPKEKARETQPSAPTSTASTVGQEGASLSRIEQAIVTMAEAQHQQAQIISRQLAIMAETQQSAMQGMAAQQAQVSGEVVSALQSVQQTLASSSTSHNSRESRRRISSSRPARESWTVEGGTIHSEDEEIGS